MRNADREAERAVLGALLIEPLRTSDAAALLQPDDFSEKRNRHVYEALLSLVARGDPVDSVTVSHELAEMGTLQSVGGRTYLAELHSCVTSSAYLIHHARIVAARARARRLVALLSGGVARIASGTPSHAELDEIAADLNRALDAVAATGSPGQPAGPVLVRMETVAPEPVVWLWPNRIALGKLSLLAGDPKLGKSTVSLDIAARVTRCGPWPDAPSALQSAGAVLILSAEDDPSDTIRPRLDAAGADPAMVSVLRAVRERSGAAERPFSLETDIAHLETALLARPETKLAIIDPVSAYLGRTDSHNNADVRGLLAPLSALAAKHRVAVLAVTHLNKGSGSALHRTMGSLAFTAAPRSIWLVASDPENSSRRLFLPNGSNIGEPVGGLAFALNRPEGALAAAVQWEFGSVALTADEVLAAQSAENGSERARAQRFLSDELAGGAVQSDDVLGAAKEKGISEKTLRRAATDLHIKPRKSAFGGPWLWELPCEDGQAGAQDGHSQCTGTFDDDGHLGAVGI
jgi:hypothetical protein